MPTSNLGIFRFPNFKSLFVYTAYTSNMAAWSMSLHQMYNSHWCMLLLMIQENSCAKCRAWTSTWTLTSAKWEFSKNDSVPSCFCTRCSQTTSRTSFSLRPARHTGVASRNWHTYRTTYRRLWPFQLRQVRDSSVGVQIIQCTLYLYGNSWARLFDITHAVWNYFARSVFWMRYNLAPFSFLFYVLHLLRINFVIFSRRRQPNPKLLEGN